MKLTDAHLSKILPGVPNLRYLWLSCVVASRAVNPPFDLTPPLYLITRDPRHCKKLTQASVGVIGRSCPELRELTLCGSMTDLSEIGRGCTNLTSLNIESCPVTDISEIGRGCTNLTSLDMNNTSVTDISEIARGCRKLTSLNVECVAPCSCVPRPRAPSLRAPALFFVSEAVTS